MSKRNMALYGLSGLLLVSVVLLNGCDTRSHHAQIDIQNAFEKENIIPLVILGSGPAGLSAAIYGVWSNIKTVVIQGPTPGGLLTETTLVENWPGAKSILGPDIIKRLEEQVINVGTKFARNALGRADFLEDTVVNIDFSSWPYRIETEQGRTLHALAIVMATGASPKMLGVPGEKEFWKKGVTTCAVCDGGFFEHKDVVVVGGGDSAAEEAMQLARHAKLVTMLVRKGSLRASATMKSRLAEYPNIKIIYNVEVKRIFGTELEVTGVELYDTKTQQTTQFPADGVFLAIGHTPNSQLVKDYIKMDEHGYVVTKGKTQQTSIPGLFAAGEIEDRLYRQAGVASGHGIQAALDAIGFLNEIGFNTTIAQRLEPNCFIMDTVKRGGPSKIPVLASAQEFAREVEQEKGIVVVDFFKDQCPRCDDLAPIFDATAQAFADKVKFVKVNAVEAIAVSRKLFIQTVPNILIYNNGKLAARYQGVLSQKDLTALIENIEQGGTNLPEWDQE